MKSIPILSILLLATIALWSAGRTASPYRGSMELSSISIPALRTVTSDQVMVYGLRVGMPLQDVDSALRQFSTTKDLDKQSGYLSVLMGDGRSEVWTGVQALVRDGKIAEISVHARTHFNDDNTPQTPYVLSTNDDLRRLFESYTSELRERLFGAAPKTPGIGAYESFFIYQDRGIKMKVFSYVDRGRTVEELAELNFSLP